MPAKSPKQWAAIRREYESGRELIKDICHRWEISNEAIRKRSNRERWLHPRRIEERGRQKLMERGEETLEIEADRWSKAYLGAREDLLVAARHAIGKFRDDVESGKVNITAWKELPHLIAALDKACAVEEKKQTGPDLTFGIDFSLPAVMAAKEQEMIDV